MFGGRPSAFDGVVNSVMGMWTPLTPGFLTFRIGDVGNRYTGCLYMNVNFSYTCKSCKGRWQRCHNVLIGYLRNFVL